MTEKRFKAIDENIWQGNEIWCVAGGKHCAEVIATAMNELINENEQLKKENEKLESLWEDKCIRDYMNIVGEHALQEMHNEKYGDK